jgi:hypothetical protein
VARDGAIASAGGAQTVHCQPNLKRLALDPPGASGGVEILPCASRLAAPGKPASTCRRLRSLPPAQAEFPGDGRLRTVLPVDGA